MPVPRVKFRCGHCNRLLSAPVNRIGRAIACPKCVQAVTVPMLGGGSELESNPDQPMRQSSDAGPASSPGWTTRDALPEFMAEFASIPDDVLAINPEDIRADIPLVLVDLAREDRPEFPVEKSPSEEWAAPEQPAKPAAIQVEKVRADSWFRPFADPADVDDGEDLATPSIEVETEPVGAIAPAPRPRRSADLVLPASVVLAWSLFVLFALALAFLAGLFIGHYYWKHL